VMHSVLTSALLRKRQPPHTWLHAPAPKITFGASGATFANIWASMPSSVAPTTRYLFSNFSPCDTVTAALPPCTTLSGLAQWKTHCAVSARRSPAWGPRTLV
jgi:hypothetical protein